MEPQSTFLGATPSESAAVRIQQALQQREARTLTRRPTRPPNPPQIPNYASPILRTPATAARHPSPCSPATAANASNPHPPPTPHRSRHPFPTNSSPVPIRAQIVYTGRVSLATRSQMPAFTLALHIPLLLLRVLRLALPVAPFGPDPTSLPPWGLPSGSSKHPSNRPRPARRLRTSHADSPLTPASPAKATLAPRPITVPLPSIPHIPQAHPNPTAPRPPSYPRPRVSTPTIDTPENRPKHTPRRLKSFLEKTLIAREASAQHPANTPQRPRTLSRPLRRSHAPCPGDLPAHPRRAYGPARPAAGLLPRRGRSRRRKLKNLPGKSAQNRLSPARPLWGRAGERRFPPSPPRFCGPHSSGLAGTLSPKSSTVTPESRS